MAEFIVSFIGPTSCLRSVLIEAEDEQQAQLRALSTSTAYLCAEYFYGNVHLDVRAAAPPLA